MSDKPIGVGDMAVMVRGCAGCTCSPLGVPFRVTSLTKKTIRCAGEVVGSAGAKGLSDYTIPLPWLKRIPPLSELEGEKRDEEITA